MKKNYANIKYNKFRMKDFIKSGGSLAGPAIYGFAIAFGCIFMEKCHPELDYKYAKNKAKMSIENSANPNAIQYSLSQDATQYTVYLLPQDTSAYQNIPNFFDIKDLSYKVK